MAKMCLYLSFMCAGMDMSNIARKQSKRRTRERMSDQEAKEIKAEEIMLKQRFKLDHPRHRIRKSKTQDKSKWPSKHAKFSKFEGFIEKVFEIKGHSCQEFESNDEGPISDNIQTFKQIPLFSQQNNKPTTAFRQNSKQSQMSPPRSLFKTHPVIHFPNHKQTRGHFLIGQDTLTPMIMAYILPQMIDSWIERKALEFFYLLLPLLIK
ncbi:hypothetical protein Tco_0715034 [Tanacetum coccineum]